MKIYSGLRSQNQSERRLALQELIKEDCPKRWKQLARGSSIKDGKLERSKNSEVYWRVHEDFRDEVALWALAGSGKLRDIGKLILEGLKLEQIDFLKKCNSLKSLSIIDCSDLSDLLGITKLAPSLSSLVVEGCSLSEECIKTIRGHGYQSLVLPATIEDVITQVRENGKFSPPKYRDEGCMSHIKCILESALLFSSSIDVDVSACREAQDFEFFRFADSSEINQHSDCIISTDLKSAHAEFDSGSSFAQSIKNSTVFVVRNYWHEKGINSEGSVHITQLQRVQSLASPVELLLDLLEWLGDDESIDIGHVAHILMPSLGGYIDFYSHCDKYVPDGYSCLEATFIPFDESEFSFPFFSVTEALLAFALSSDQLSYSDDEILRYLQSWFKARDISGSDHMDDAIKNALCSHLDDRTPELPSSFYNFSRLVLENHRLLAILCSLFRSWTDDLADAGLQLNGTSLIDKQQARKIVMSLPENDAIIFDEDYSSFNILHDYTLEVSSKELGAIQYRGRH